jgi:hypothetical protein
MLNQDTLTSLVEQLGADDVLRIDPVHEYEYRKHLREFSERRLAKTHDESDELVELGRPTGP